MTPPQILISAGEASGDLYAARLATALRARTGATLFGMGGERMAEAGVELIADYHETAVVGVIEIWNKVPAALRVLSRLEREAKRRSPKLAILVDSPGLNLHVGRRMRRLGVRMAYFISPQVWAWRRWRMRLIKRLVERVLVIFPFEEKIYRDAGVPADFIGHPLVDLARPSMSREELAARFGLDPSRPTVALLPGSRRSEIAHHYPRILEACERLSRRARMQFVLAAAPGLEAGEYERYTRPGVHVCQAQGATNDVLAAADCAVVASGTATVEATLVGTPMVVIYRVSALSAAVLRHMIHVPFISMVNLIAGRRVVPELIQDAFTPEAVESEVWRLLESPAAREAMKRDLAEVRSQLGPAGAIERAADILAQML